MKIILIPFFLFFSFSINAEDIRDFQIEGFSIGDSLLDYFTLEEINENTAYLYDEYGNQGKEIASFGTQRDLNKFDMVEFEFKTLNKKYEIASIKAYIYFKENINECTKLQNQIFNDIKNLFPNKEYFEDGPFNHPGYPGGDVIILKRIGFSLNADLATNIDIICYDISKKINKTDRLSLTIRSDEYNEWIVELYN